jgi:transposase
VPQRGHHVPRAPTPGTAAQKKALHATERDTPRVAQARAASQHRTAAGDLRRFKLVDEARVNRAMPRLYGRAPQGERVHGTVPLHDGTNLTRLGALGVEGLQAVMTVEGASDADVFRTSVQQVRGPTWAPGDIVVLDNVPVHNMPGIPQALARRCARLLYVPPYSPDVSPMELCLSQVKTALRAAKARTREALETAIQQAMEIVTAIDAQHWVRHSGYAL